MECGNALIVLGRNIQIVPPKGTRFIANVIANVIHRYLMLFIGITTIFIGMAVRTLLHDLLAGK